MLYALGVLIVLAIIFGPSLWVKFVMRRYSTEKPEMPGTGGEFAKHLIKRFSLKDVEVETTELGDHYDPIEKKVRLGWNIANIVAWSYHAWSYHRLLTNRC